MHTGFKDPLEVKCKKEIKNPLNFDQPPYDQRSSCYQNAGTYYGLGKKNPVGISGNPKNTYAVPIGRVDTMKVSDIHRGDSTNVEIKKQNSSNGY